MFVERSNDKEKNTGTENSRREDVEHYLAISPPGTESTYVPQVYQYRGTGSQEYICGLGHVEMYFYVYSTRLLILLCRKQISYL